MMRSLIACAFAVVAVAVAAPASAKESLDPRLAKALACSATTQADARLACFDRAMAELSRAVKAGTLNIGTLNVTAADLRLVKRLTKQAPNVSRKSTRVIER